MHTHTRTYPHTQPPAPFLFSSGKILKIRPSAHLNVRVLGINVQYGGSEGGSFQDGVDERDASLRVLAHWEHTHPVDGNGHGGVLAQLWVAVVTGLNQQLKHDAMIITNNNDLY